MSNELKKHARNEELKKRADLPPAGHARNEELKKRADYFEEAAEKKATALSANAYDESKLTPDEEIQYAYQQDVSQVTNAQPGFVYRWAHKGTPMNQTFQQDLTRRHIEGWQVVTGDMPECPQFRNAMGERQIGDTVLVRMPAALKQRLELRNQARAEKQAATSLAESRELAAKANVVLVEDLSAVEQKYPGTLAKMQGKAQAEQRFNEMVRTGSIPGAKLTTQNM